MKRRVAETLLWLGLFGVVAVFGFGAIALATRDWDMGLHVVIAFYGTSAALLGALVMEKYL